MADNLTGYVALTSGLNELYNEKSRASILLEGVIESKYREIDVSKYGDYIFYNGSLEEKYGVYDLVKAFNALNRNGLKLVITGYHSFEEARFKKAIESNPNIIYLGMSNVDEILSLENGSLLNINPRPYTEDFDRYLIPVNMLDYLSSSSIAVSVKNSKLQKYFEEDCIWVNSSDVEDLVDGINRALNLKKDERNKMIKNAINDVNKTYSMAAVNKKLILFLKQFLKQKD